MSAVKEANTFLAPVFEKEQLISFNEVSLILRLSKSLIPSADKKVAVPLVINHALALLLRIHKEICDHDAEPVANRLENPGERRTIFSLLDLIVLEGIYPSLSPGVGIPIERRARSFVLPQQMTTPLPTTTTRVQEVSEFQNIELLERVVSGLIGVLSPQDQTATADKASHNIWKSPRGYKGIEAMVRERCLVDLIAGCGELALSPEHRRSAQAGWKAKFNDLLEGIQTGQLLPLLLSLLHPASPPWFRGPIAKYLSQLPVSRPQGVRSIIELFLSTASSGNISNSASVQLSIDALSKASRLISSVPTSMTARAYFTKVCPQLLDLLRSMDPGMERASAYVIAELLGKKGPGIDDIVDDEIVNKILLSFNPTPPSTPEHTQAPVAIKTEKKSSSALLAFEDDLPAEAKPSRSPLVFEIVDETDTKGKSEFDDEPAQSAPLVSEVELSMAFRNLEVLLASHPTPLLPQKLIAPILIPLWGLMGFAKSTGRSSWHGRAATLLRSYFAVSLDQRVLQKIQDNLTFTGEDNWEFGPGSSGGVEIRAVDPPRKAGGVNMDLINSRVEEFLGILGGEGVPNGVLNDFFLQIFRKWLSRGGDEEPLKMLITVKILQEMLQTHGEALAKKPTETLQIVKGVLDEYVSFLEALKAPKKEKEEKPSLSNLNKIVEEAPLPSLDSEGEESDETQQTETVAMALTLLSILISSPDSKLTETDERLVITMHPSLQYLSSATTIDPNLTSLAINITSLLMIHAPQASTKSEETPLADKQREKYTTSLSYLRDPLIPVRAHGLYLLRELILERAPILDVTNTARLLITMLKDGDSFVYLNVVKCLSALTDRHSKTVTKMLVDAYMNDEDVLNLGDPLGLDERLRIGEALLGTVQRLHQTLVGETAQCVAEGMLSIISRRRKNKNPVAPGAEDEDDDMELDIDEDTGLPLTTKQLADRERAAKMVKGWTATAHEDLRIRTSALSVLGMALQSNPSGLAGWLSDVIDTAVAVLTQETTMEAAILRRAAVVAISAVLNGLVRKDEEDKEGVAWRGDVWSVVKERVQELKRVLGYVRVTDVDGLVREQAGTVEESLEAVVQRGVFGGRAVVEM